MRRWQAELAIVVLGIAVGFMLALLAGCGDRALPLDEEPSAAPPTVAAACCETHPGQPAAHGAPGQIDLWVCQSSACQALQGATECTTLSNTHPTYCQVPASDDCVAVYLENITFQTVYCF